MNTRTTTAPTVEPLTLAETKVHLREDLTDAGNDALITSLIAVARQACEHRVQRALMLQTLEATLDAFPCASARNPDAAIELIMPPVIDITSVTYTAANGSSTVLASTDYTLDARSEPARLVPAYGLNWPDTQNSIAAVRVVYRAGYSASATAATAQAAVPAALRQWMLLFVEMLETKLVLSEALSAMVGGTTQLYAASSEIIKQCMETLTARAVASGDIRLDMEPLDLLRAVSGVATASAGPNWAENARRLVDVLLLGIRTSPSQPPIPQ